MRRGAILLEVLAALSIFSVSALAAVEVLRQASETGQRTRAAEVSFAGMDRLLAAHSLLRRQELDQRLGLRTVGEYQVEVQRPSASLYRVTLSDSTDAQLTTLLYRPEMP